MKNLIASLWAVLDKSTSEIMIEFYKNMLDEKNHLESLRQAKSATIE